MKFLKFFKKEIKKDSQCIFVVIIMSYFGDSLVGNGLFQNIKRIYPNSKTVFVISKAYYEVAKYQKDVDEVIVFDKNGDHKGFFGLLKFIKEFPYKNIKYIFKMCKKERADIIAFLLRPEKIIDYNADVSIPSHMRYCNLLKEVTNEKIIYYPIEYNADNNIPSKFENIIFKDKKYIALCTISSNPKKDMPIETAIALINKLEHDNYKVIFVGVGDRTKTYAQDLKNSGCNFIDLSNQTSIYELAQVLRNCEALISVDTGTMHLGYANKVPTICVFYTNCIQGWAPDKSVYPYTEVITDTSLQNIYKTCTNLITETQTL